MPFRKSPDDGYNPGELRQGHEPHPDNPLKKICTGSAPHGTRSGSTDPDPSSGGGRARPNSGHRPPGDRSDNVMAASSGSTGSCMTMEGRAPPAHSALALSVPLGGRGGSRTHGPNVRCADRSLCRRFRRRSDGRLWSGPGEVTSGRRSSNTFPAGAAGPGWAAMAKPDRNGTPWAI